MTPRRVLAAAMVLAAALLLYEGRGLSFVSDEWSFVLDRRGWDVHTFLEPHNGHLSIVLLAVYKSMFEVVGAAPYWPYRLLVVAAHLLVALLLYLVLRRRGEWPAVLGAIVVLFLGAAWQDLVWGFQIGFLIPIACGLGAILLLRRRDRTGDLLTGVLMAVALASSSMGVPVVLGVGAALVWARDWRRVPVVLVPLLVYVAWYLGYADDGVSADVPYASDKIEWEDVEPAFFWARETAAAAAGGIFGQGLKLGRILLVLGLVALVVRLVQLRRVSPTVVGLIVCAVSFWYLTGLARRTIASSDSSRYIYIGALVMVFLAVELSAGALRTRGRLLAAAAVVAVSALSGVIALRDGVEDHRLESDIVRAELTALEMAPPGGDGTAGFGLYGVGRITRQNLPKIVSELGRPSSYRPSGLPGAPRRGREGADLVLLAAEDLQLEPVPTARPAGAEAPRATAVVGSTSSQPGCLEVRPADPGAIVEVLVPPGGLVVGAGDRGVEVRLRRWADGYPKDPLGRVAAGDRRLLAPPPDAGTVPWRAQLRSDAALRACSSA